MLSKCIYLLAKSWWLLSAVSMPLQPHHISSRDENTHTLVLYTWVQHSNNCYRHLPLYFISAKPRAPRLNFTRSSAWTSIGNLGIICCKLLLVPFSRLSRRNRLVRSKKYICLYLYFCHWGDISQFYFVSQWCIYILDDF